jgi:hypothetical protein
MESPTDTETDVEAVNALEGDLLGLIEEVSARGALTDGDRHQLSFRAETVCSELRSVLASEE